jgi:hypothetical protein
VPDRPREDIAAPSGASVCVGHTAYAVSENHVIFGPHWQVRKELRQLLKTPGTAPTLAFAIRQHLEELAPQLLLARAYAKGRDYVKASQAGTGAGGGTQVETAAAADYNSPSGQSF